ncbi:MAG: Crp/Fnr family transcriptional regulator [Rhodoferax sp.]|nr:Crp/Fnr family transcriptional regulator [Rhodoferax sp.]MDP3654148.1 Crp/Fnr family transcriptional regulator [Rhodoferax sp.]
MTPPAPPLPAALHALLPADLQAVAVLLPLKRGERLFVQGHRPARMFYVVDGEVVLQRLGIQGENVVLQRVRQGWVAEASLQSPSYHCEALVTSAGALIALPVDAVRQALAEDPAFAARWIGMLNQELKRLRAQCERLSLVGVKERLLHLIETEGEGGCLLLKASLKSVAAEIGVTHEALYRTLAAMEKQGQLQRMDGQLRLGWKRSSPRIGAMVK